MDWFTQHPNDGYTLLACLAMFPRLTLLLAGFVTGGMAWWLGWIFAPHLLVGFLSIPYWNTNPDLVVCAWILALSGTGVEVNFVRRNR